MKEIPSLKGIFINEDGTIIYSKKLNRNLSICKMIKHYKTRDYIQYLVNVNQRSYCVSRLVYEAYKGFIPKGKCIDHIDNNPQNNNYKNLQLLTRSENNKKCYDDDPLLRIRQSESSILANQDGYIKKSNGVKNPHKNIRCIETGEVFKTLREAGEKYKINISNIWFNINKNYSTRKGLNFEYV